MIGNLIEISLFTLAYFTMLTTIHESKNYQYEYFKKKVLIKHSVASNVPLSLFYDFKQSLNLEYEKQILRGHDMIIGCIDTVH